MSSLVPGSLRFLALGALAPTVAWLVGATTPLVAAEAPRTWPAEWVTPLTPARIAPLTAAERAAWEDYLAESERRRALHRQPVERTPATEPPGPSALATTTAKSGTSGTTVSTSLPLKGATKSFATREAVALATRVVTWQLPEGGWNKGGRYHETRRAARPSNGTWSYATFDNNATIPEIRYLALVAHALSDGPERAALDAAVGRGIGYVFAAQYPHGGFPQIYPLAGDYHDAVTLNDGAMINALALLRDIAKPTPEFARVADGIRTEAALRLEKGIACLLALQIGAGKTRTVWAQQYDALTLAPAPARAFEPIALSASESAGVVEFLAKQTPATPAIAAAIQQATAWFERVALRDVVWRADGVAGRLLVSSPGAPPLWARFYEIGTDKPVFGDRDRSIHYDVAAVSLERRNGYAWFGPYGAKLARK